MSASGTTNESGSGCGAIIGPDDGSRAPPWSLHVPAVAVIGYVGYRRFSGGGGGAGGGSGGFP